MGTAPKVLAAALVLTGALAAETMSALRARADALIEADGIRGAVLLAKGGRIVLAKGYGLANIELGVPNTPQTKFRIASITKQFTAAAILRLQEQGKLTVKDPISRYIRGTPPAWAGITIEELLTHTSGIPSYTDPSDNRAHNRESVQSPLELVRKFYGFPLEFAPGTKFHYDNSGYILLGVIIEEAAGMKYEDCLRKYIFEPLQMHDTGYDWPSKILKNRASGYSRGENGHEVNAEFIDMGRVYAAGALYSTVLDLFQWDRALYTTRILSAGSIAQAFAPNGFEWAKGIQYGYGWGISEVHGHKTVGHGGGIEGFSSVIWRAIEEDATVIVLSNHDDGPNMGNVGKKLLELLLNTRMDE